MSYLGETPICFCVTQEFILVLPSSYNFASRYEFSIINIKIIHDLENLVGPDQVTYFVVTV